MRLGFDKLLERRLVSEGGDRDPEGCVCVCGEGEGVIGRLYLKPHRHHQNYSELRRAVMRAVLTVRDKVARQCPVTVNNF